MSKYSYSFDEENYSGSFDTIEEAVAEAVAEQSGEDETDRRSFHVGERRPPVQPETWWHANQWLEHAECFDDYSGDWTDDWDRSTPEQQAELEIEVRAVLAAWLDRHKLRPKFFCIDKTQEFFPDGTPVEKARKK